MKSEIALALTLAVCLLSWPVVTSTKAAEDLSAFSVPAGSAVPDATSGQVSTQLWPAHVCAEIRRVEKTVISGARPTDRGMTRIGLLMLEQLHCGIDVSKKLQADQAVLETERQKAQSDYQDNLEAAVRAGSGPHEPIVVQTPQADVPQAAPPSPPRTIQCFTNRFGAGMSSTTCR